MFDLEKHKTLIAGHYFKMLKNFNNLEKTNSFIQRWLELLSYYSKSKGFLSFQPKIPVIQRLSPSAKGVLVVQFENSRVAYVDGHVSVFPLYPFQVQCENNNFCCREGFELLVDYIRLTGIRVLCFHFTVIKYNQWSLQLKEKFPNLRVYGPNSLFTFYKVVKFLSRSLTSPPSCLSLPEVSQSAAAPASTPSSTRG